MTNRGRTFRLGAVVVLTGLALTGFAPERGGHGSSHGHGGGGGCGSSSSDHDTSSSSSGTSGSHYHDDDDYYDDDDYDSTSGGSTGSDTATEGRATLVSCASAAQPYAEVEVSNSNSTTETFHVLVTFRDSAGISIAEGEAPVEVAGYDSATVEVDFTGDVAQLDECDVEETAYVATG